MSTSVPGDAVPNSWALSRLACTSTFSDDLPVQFIECLDVIRCEMIADEFLSDKSWKDNSFRVFKIKNN